MASPATTTKPVVYAPIPDTFDQNTQYIVQLEPVEKVDHFFVGIKVKTLVVEDNKDLMPSMTVVP